MNLRRRILDISFQKGLVHLGSCLGSVDIIDRIYRTKEDRDRFVLSCGHCALALYVVLESRGIMDASKQEFIHPERGTGIDVSTGSLGHGLPIALGMALADRRRKVYCLVSDGECAEGSIWESLMIASENNVDNLRVIVNINGWGAYGRTSLNLRDRLVSFGDVEIVETTVEQLPFLKGQDAHYHKMTREEYEKAVRGLPA